MGKRAFELLVFDWDGTLMDSGDKIVRCWQQASVDLGFDVAAAEDIRQLIGLSLTEMCGRLVDGLSAEQSTALITRYREQWLYLDKTEMPLFDDVESGLSELEEAGYLLAVATGKSRAGLDRALRSTNLSTRFCITRCADESRSKPHPQMLFDVLERTGMMEDQALMIGDTEFDMQMASNASMQGVGVAWGYHDEERLMPMTQHPIQHSFAELVNYLL